MLALAITLAFAGQPAPASSNPPAPALPPLVYKAAPDAPSTISLRPFVSPEGFPDVDNAALLYWPAMHRLALWRLTEQNRYIDFSRPEGAAEDWVLSDSVKAALQANQEVIGMFVRASQVRQCKWGYEYGMGWVLVLPHLSEMRSGARMVRADVQRLMNEGAPSREIAPRTAALMRMGDHLGAEPVLISTLVGTAIFNLGADAADLAMKKGLLDEAGRRELLGAVSIVNDDDPLNYLDAFRQERRMSVNSVRALRGDPRGPLATSIREMMKTSGENLSIFDFTMTTPESEVTRLDGAYAELLEAWTAADATTRFDAIAKKAERGEYGLYAKILLPAMHKPYEASENVKKRLVELRAALERYQPPAKAKAEHPAPVAPAAPAAPK